MIFRFKPYQNKYIYQIPVAGHTNETIQVRYSIPNLMIIEGKVKKKLYRHSFYRVLEIPRAYTSEDVKYVVQNGLLHIEIHSKEKL